jgi:anaerobic magnesium-protoporphyrin IX monomethyl ester cyclase
MQVLLIAPPIMDRVNGSLVSIAMDAHRECPPYGMYLLLAALRERGHDAKMADLIAAGTDRIDDYRDAVADADLIGIGATSMSWSTAVSVIHQVRAINPDVPIVLGGIHPSMFDRYVLTAFPVDYVVRGEGEVALCALADALEGDGDVSQVPNLSWRRDDATVVRNAIPRLISKYDLPSFPLPDYSELPQGIYGALSIESSRGCAFDCSFCSTSYRQTWRGIDPELFVDRLETVLPHTDRTRHAHVHVIDDEFSMNTRRATKIANIIAERGLNPALVFDSRANDLHDEEYVAAIAPFTQQFLVGAECGYDEGLELIGKGTTCERLDGAAKMLTKYGIAHRADFSFVLGLPWETRTEVERTIAFATNLHATYGVRVLLQWYCQIPGSRLWDAAQKRGTVTEAMYDEHGFFGDLYLFRSGVNLTPDEIYEVSDKVAAVLKVMRLRYPDVNMIEYAFPEPIAKYYPRFLQDFHDTGLASLRQVARPVGRPRRDRAEGEIELPVMRKAPDVRTGIPLRHFEGVHIPDPQ